jgi:hypothetical protein
MRSNEDEQCVRRSPISFFRPGTLRLSPRAGRPRGHS